ncbi:hypothetical protein [Faecalibaculum rodentium]|uniref:hypothetical protein n=1 Tax=Faecalibaculum rodentium TaxID=1702221 RepID=UPI0026F2808C|nr:hypothetical protein [Faecalibaculum rodentium]
MLDSFQDVGLSLNGEDGYLYAVPVNYGFEMDEKSLTVYVNCQTRLQAGPHAKGCPCTLQFHAFRDFPDRPYKGHKHDCRLVTAKGTIEILDWPRPLRHSGIRMKCS